ncbi:MAG: matrixin family metalloprotease [Pseudomonadota bacterium]
MPKLVGTKWGDPTLNTPGGVVTWSFAPVGHVFELSSQGDPINVGPPNQIAVDLVRDAFQAWTDAGNVEFVQVADDGTGPGGDIRISFAVLSGNLLGWAYFPTNPPRPIAGDVLLTPSIIGNRDVFVNLAMHEIGHAIGLDHVDLNAIMNGTIVGRTALTADDINGVRQIYGAQDGVAPTYSLGPTEANFEVLDATSDLIIAGNALNNSIQGGDGAETISGGVGADTLGGGPGNDVLEGGVQGDVFLFNPGDGQDRITDFNVVQDQIRLGAGISIAGVSASLADGGDDIILGLGAGDQIVLDQVINAAQQSIPFLSLADGTALTLGQLLPGAPGPMDALQDLNGDGTSDVLWFNGGTRAVTSYWVQGGQTTTVFLGVAGADYQIAGVADFSGDGTDDILWFNAQTRQIGYYQMDTGTPVWQGLGIAGPGLQIAGTGDFNGDNTDDILWSDAGLTELGILEISGNATTWRSLGQGGPGWEAAATADFTGDGTDDILWFNTASGAIGVYDVSGAAPVFQIVGGGGAAWQIAGAGDFNNDGTDDVLWFNASTNGFGFHALTPGGAIWTNLGQGGPAWEIAGVGDYSGDGTDDVLWYNTASRDLGFTRLDGGTPAFQLLGGGGPGWAVAGADPIEELV